MRSRTLSLLATSLLMFAIGTTGCAAPTDSSPASPGTEEGSESDLTKSSPDNAIEGKLRGILKDVTFTSESDYPYVIVEGDVVADKRLSTKIIRQKLQAAVKANTSSKRDILPASCRSARTSVSEAIAAGDAAVVPADKDDDDYLYAHHDKQLGIALKVMRSQLKSVTGYTFGTNESGDEDDVGPVVYVYVGISKTTGKLIALITEAVYT